MERVMVSLLLQYGLNMWSYIRQEAAPNKYPHAPKDYQIPWQNGVKWRLQKRLQACRGKEQRRCLPPTILPVRFPFLALLYFNDAHC
jgi:hypothetical protein